MFIKATMTLSDFPSYLSQTEEWKWENCQINTLHSLSQADSRNNFHHRKSREPVSYSIFRPFSQLTDYSTIDHSFVLIGYQGNCRPVLRNIEQRFEPRHPPTATITSRFSILHHPPYPRVFTTVPPSHAGFQPCNQPFIESTKRPLMKHREKKEGKTSERITNGPCSVVSRDTRHRSDAWSTRNRTVYPAILAARCGLCGLNFLTRRNNEFLGKRAQGFRAHRSTQMEASRCKRF